MSSQISSLQYPAILFHPLNGSFAPKQLSLAAGGAPLILARQTNAKTAPTADNGRFSTRVLSRRHAELWCEDGRIHIKDAGSWNGSYVNGKRLSEECEESAPFELKTGDVVELGIDVFGEDNKSIMHHKVAARVTCVCTADDALGAAGSAASCVEGQRSFKPRL